MSTSPRNAAVRRSRPGWLAGVLPLATVVAIAVTPGGTRAASAAVAPAVQPAAAGAVAGSAPGGPGAASYLDVARKDCFGTARNRRSKVWFTVAGGVLSDVYYPTIESSNVKTVQYVVTDGRTFVSRQQGDMTYRVTTPDRSGMVCRVTSTDARHGFAIVTDYLTDPARASVVMRSRLVPRRGDGGPAFRSLKVYVRSSLHIDNTGGGVKAAGGADNGGADNAFTDRATTALVATDARRAAGPGPFAATVFSALAASRPFRAETSGFAGTASDGLRQLEARHRLVHQYASAANGNVTQTALVSAAPGQPFTLALGFGPRAGAAIRAARMTAREPLHILAERYEQGWRSYDGGLKQPPRHIAGMTAAQDSAMHRAYWRSVNVIKADEDKTYPGAFVASPADPWGQAVPAQTTHPGWTYREVFARDDYEIFTGLLAGGDRATARAMVRFLYGRAQQPDGSFPRDSLLNGAVAPDTFGLVEIDQDAYPLLMALDAGFAGQVSFYRQHIRPDADFIVDHGPAYGAERWEEHPGFSPSTIAAEIAGLTAASRLARAAGDPGRARVYQATADFYQRNVARWTVTSSGPYGRRYFLRLSPSGHPNRPETYDLGNGSISKVDQRDVADAGFLELARLGELPARAGDVLRSLPVTDSVIESQTASGPGWHRYGVRPALFGKPPGATDGYGDCWVPDPTDCSPAGAPWFGPGQGSGHPWPLLSGERAEQDLQTGRPAAATALALTMQRMAWGAGTVPEQVWEDPRVPASPLGSDPATASIGFRSGEAAGSADPLVWAQAQYVRLVRDLAAGRLLDQPPVTRARYVAHGRPARVRLSFRVTAPGAVTVPGHVLTGAPGMTEDILASQEPVTTTARARAVVRGTTVPWALVEVAVGRPGSPGNATVVVRAVAGSSGAFLVPVATPRGRAVVTVTAVAGGHASGWAQQIVTRR